MTNELSFQIEKIPQLTAFVDEDRWAQGKTEGPWGRQGALGVGIPMLFLEFLGYR